MRRKRLVHGDLGVAAAAAVLAAAASSLMLAARPQTYSLLLGAITITAVAPIAVRVAQRRFDPFEPLLVFSLAWAGMFVVRPLAMLHYNEFSYIWAGGLQVRAAFEKMLLLALLGGIAFLVGYGLPAGRFLATKVPVPPAEYRVRRIAVLALVPAALGLGLYAAFLFQVGLSNIGIIFGGQSAAQTTLLARADKFLLLGPILLVGATVTTFAIGLGLRHRGILTLSVVLMAASWILWNTVGSRIVLFPMFAALGIFWFLSKEARPNAATLVALLLLGVLASAVVGEQRYADARQQGGILAVTSRVVTHPADAAYPLLRGSDNAMAPGLAAAISVVPARVRYSYGVPLVRDLFARPIPRALWAGKPLPPREELVRTINPTGYQTRNANPEFSNLLLPFLSWGMFGALFSILYGILARGVFEWFKLHRSNLAAQLMYALMLPLFLPAFRDGLVDAAALWALMLIPVWALFRAGGVRATAL